MSEKLPVAAPTGALEAFLSGIIDYAGLFPPAALSLDDSIRNYLRYRSGPYRWILGSFVCPGAKLPDLSTYSDLLQAGTRLPVSVLGTASTDMDAWKRSVHALTSEITAFEEQMGDVARTAAVELKLPLAVATVASKRNEALAFLYGEFSGAVFSVDVFVEIVPEANAEVVERVAAALLSLDDADGRERAGMKIRTGGVKADAFPDPDSLADFICACRDVGIRFKATAGLHHPLRHFSDEVQAEMFGFLNVFVGALAAIENNLTPAQLSTILTAEDIRSFHFDDEGLRVGEFHVPRAHIEDLRRDFAVSFGSCSFVEPIEDLHALGLL